MEDSKLVVPFPTNSVWIQVRHSQAKAPIQKKIEGVKDSEHGTYESHPYYMFVDAQSTGKKMLISDLGLLAELTYIPGTRKKNTAGFLGAQFKISVKNVKDSGQFENAILSYNDESTDELSFLVKGTPSDFNALPSGNHPFGHYVRSDRRVPNDHGNDQPFGNVFTKKVFAFNLLLRSWDLTKLSVDDFQKTGNDKELLMLPDGTTMNYEQQGETVIPYGWIYETMAGGEGSEYSHMACSSADIMNSVQKAAGFQVSGGVNLKAGPVKASANFSVAKNNSILEKIENMYEKEQTYSEHKYIETECVFVIDKGNVALNDRNDDGKHHGEKGGFRNAIRELRTEVMKAPDGRLSNQQLLDFIAFWGTHYAYAATFGAKGSAVVRYSKDYVKQLINKEVDVKKAWSAGVSVKVFGSGANINYSNDSAAAREQYKQLESITGEGFTSFSCVGGGTCDMGKPSAGERVPIYLDLRPISELLGPPFFNDELTAIRLRDQLEGAIRKYVFKPSVETADVISVSEIEFSAISIVVGSYMIELGDKCVSIDGPYFSFPPNDLISKKGPIILKDSSSGDRFMAVDGTSARFYHKQKPFNLEVELTINAQEKDWGRVSGRNEWGGWYGDKKLSITIDPLKEGKQRQGPFVQKRNFKEVYEEPELDTVVEFSFEMTTRKIDFKSLLGFSI